MQSDTCEVFASVCAEIKELSSVRDSWLYSFTVTSMILIACYAFFELNIAVPIAF